MKQQSWPKTIPAAPQLPIAELLFMDDTLLAASSRETMVQKYNLLRLELGKWGLQVNPEKTAYYCSPHSTTRGPIQLEDTVIHESDNLLVFGIPLSVPFRPTAIMDTAMSKATRKFYANKHVFLAEAPLKSKLKMFRSVVGGSLLWYSSAVSPNAQAMSSINALQCELVAKMAGFRRKTEETWLDWRLRREAPPASSHLDSYRTLTWWREQQRLTDGISHKGSFYPYHTKEEESLNQSCNSADWRLVKPRLSDDPSTETLKGPCKPGLFMTMGIDPIVTILLYAHIAASLNPEPNGKYAMTNGSIHLGGNKFEAAGERPLEPARQRPSELNKDPQAASSWHYELPQPGLPEHQPQDPRPEHRQDPAYLQRHVPAQPLRQDHHGATTAAQPQPAVHGPHNTADRNGNLGTEINITMTESGGQAPKLEPPEHPPQDLRRLRARDPVHHPRRDPAQPPLPDRRPLPEGKAQRRDSTDEKATEEHMQKAMGDGTTGIETKRIETGQDEASNYDPELPVPSPQDPGRLRPPPPGHRPGRDPAQRLLHEHRPQPGPQHLLPGEKPQRRDTTDEKAAEEHMQRAMGDGTTGSETKRIETGQEEASNYDPELPVPSPQDPGRHRPPSPGHRPGRDPAQSLRHDHRLQPGSEHLLQNEADREGDGGSQQTAPPELPVQEATDATSLLVLPKLALLSLAAAWDEPFLAHNAPQWFWTTFDKGAEYVARGACWKMMARLLEQAFRQQGQGEDHSDSFWTDTELIRNHYATRWWRHAQRREQRGEHVPGTPPTVEELQRLVNKIADLVFRAWWRKRTTILTGGGRLKPCGCLDITDAETSSDEESCSSTPTPRATMRSRSPRNRRPFDAHLKANTDPDKAIDVDEQHEDEDDSDIHSLMEHKHKEVPMNKRSPTRLWKELPPERKSSSVRRLLPPWKKGGNPALRPRPPSRSPPRAPKAKARPQVPPKCQEEVPAPTTPTAPASSSTDRPDTTTNAELTPDDAIAIWQAIFEWEAQESLDPSTVPLLLTHISDSIVETLADKTETEHSLMVDILPQFLARIQTDLAEALLRARALRNRLTPDDPRTAPTGKKRPAEPYETEEDDDNDESVYMQTAQSRSSTPPRSMQPNNILCDLHAAFGQLQPKRATSRAIRLMQRLQDHDGHLEVDRQALESLLIAISGDVPPEPEGDALILEMGWVGTWWGRLTGTQPLGPQPIDLDLEFMEKHTGNDATHSAEEADEAAREEAYQRWANDAGATHMEELEAAKAKAEDEDTLREAMGYSWEPPTKRLCIGICIDDGRRAKAWEWELDKGATIQVHIKAEKKEFSGRWLREGRPIREDEVPELLRHRQEDKAPAVAVPLPAIDLAKPATRELYSRWSLNKVSDQAVVQIGGIALLMAFKEELFPRECQQELDMRDTYDVSKYDNNLSNPGNTPGQPSGHNEPAHLPETHHEENGGNGLTTEPTDTMLSEATTVAVHQAEAPHHPSNMDITADNQGTIGEEEDMISNPDSYYNGRIFYEKHGRGDDEGTERGSDST
ncbi:unnamed protein product [Symbiodinium sp. CCMP2592]|nr:unnamed protein product [Symbiodinium sp. CCMP2592]